MSCNNPLLARRLSDGSMEILSRERWKVAEAEHYFGKENVFLLPCGKCSGCLINRRKEYAVRCAMEAKEHNVSSFITLTYDDAHNRGYLIKRDLIYFIKKLRNKGYKLRYFGCGEYGGQTLRPHYHIILFGYIPKDIKFYAKSPSGVALYTSEEISRVWSKGFVTIQHFDPYAAGYVAGYTTKKIGKNEGFLVMSRRPGLGFEYMKRNAAKIADYDFICDDFGSIKKAHAPRYFERVAKLLNIDLDFQKVKRIEAIQVANAGEFAESLFVSREKEDKERINKKRLL